MQITSLEWLAGAWQGDHDGGALEEYWMRPAGGSMLGSSRVVAEGKTVHAEFLLLEEIGDGMRLTLILPGRRQVEMQATAVTERQIVYQDAEDDPHERLTYRVDEAGELRVKLEKMRDGKPAITDFHMRRPAGS